MSPIRVYELPRPHPRLETRIIPVRVYELSKTDAGISRRKHSAHAAGRTIVLWPTW